MASDEWLDTRQAAAYLGYSLDYFRNLAAAGQIPGGRRRSTPKGLAPWRFRRSALDEWLNDPARSASETTAARPA